ncbi:unnamed protein product [Amoebophrya sp. A25]|nr:unnamed protein product [Amoebophrya sp. A25]|eukprot:GSA25T00024440001.1
MRRSRSDSSSVLTIEIRKNRNLWMNSSPSCKYLLSKMSSSSPDIPQNDAAQTAVDMETSTEDDLQRICDTLRRLYEKENGGGSSKSSARSGGFGGCGLVMDDKIELTPLDVGDLNVVNTALYERDTSKVSSAQLDFPLLDLTQPVQKHPPLRSVRFVEEKNDDQVDKGIDIKDISSSRTPSCTVSSSLSQKASSSSSSSPPIPSTSMFHNKIRYLARLFRQFKGRVVVHTGAGISTNAKIPDFRGPQGLWTLAEKKEKQQQPPPTPGTTTSSSKAPLIPRFESCEPTLTHHAITKLAQTGFVSHVVTQNIDGLHTRANLPEALLSELHGCVFLEECRNCGMRYRRNFDVCRKRVKTTHSNSTTSDATGPTTTASSSTGPTTASTATLEGGNKQLHSTGRDCESCGRATASLTDTIVHFGESLRDLDKAKAACAGADPFSGPGEQDKLHLVLGSSLSVAPANTLPQYKVGTCLVSTQPTACDKKCVQRGGFLLRADADLVMGELCKILELVPSTGDIASTSSTRDHVEAEVDSIHPQGDDTEQEGESIFDRLARPPQVKQQPAKGHLIVLGAEDIAG